MSFRHREFSAAVEYLKAGIAYCDEHNLDSWIRYMTAYRSQISMALGHWDDALRDAQTVIRHPRVAPVSKIPALATLGRIRARRGDPESEVVTAARRPSPKATVWPCRPTKCKGWCRFSRRAPKRPGCEAERRRRCWPICRRPMSSA